MKIPFIPGEGPEGYLPVNFYYTPNHNGAPALIGRPGLLEFGDLSNFNEVKAIHNFGGVLYAVCGGKLHKINADGESATIGNTMTDDGPAWIEDNGKQLQIVSGKTMYSVVSGTLASVSTGFSPSSLAYTGGYFLASAEDSKNFFESEVNDATDYNELDYAITTVQPDNLVGVYVANGQVYAMGDTSGEVYYNSGGSSFGFSKIPGGNIPTGTCSPKNPTELLGILVVLNSEKVVIQVSTTPVKLSSPLVDKTIDDLTVTDSIGFSYTSDGHTFWVLTFPTSNKTLVLDLTTKMWFEWKTGTGRWRPNCYAYCYGKHLFGDFENGKIYELNDTTYTDDGTAISRECAMPLPDGNTPFDIPSFRLDMETGVGLATGQGSDPKVMLTYSIDGGKTWSNEIWRDIGKAGEYKHRVIWNRLGSPYRFTPKVKITDPIKVIITGAYIGDT